MTPARTSSARRSRSASMRRAACSSRQPVATVCTTPAPSRYLATKYGDSMTTRSLPSFPAVSGAVRLLPRRSFHRAKRSPLRTKVSAPAGSGFVKVLRNTVPTAHLPFPLRPLACGNVQVKQRGQGVEGFLPEPLAAHEAGQQGLADAEQLGDAVAGQPGGVDR